MCGALYGGFSKQANKKCTTDPVHTELALHAREGGRIPDPEDCTRAIMRKSDPGLTVCTREIMCVASGFYSSPRSTLVWSGEDENARNIRVVQVTNS